MIELGLGALAHANTHAGYHSWHNDKWNELSVLQAAHAAELLIKARIAEEHPLLIFNNLPRNIAKSNDRMGIKELIENGRTYQYQELPDILWASTGLKIPNFQLYKDFGKLRNTVQHFTSDHKIDFSQKALEFIFGVIDPFIHDCWGLYAIDYNEDEEAYTYFLPTLIKMKIEFLVPPSAQGEIEYCEFEWDNDTNYKTKMMKRLELRT